MAKVVVAMSGGVDSSVAAYLLKEQGHDVTGLMLRLWSEPGKEDSNRCCTPDSVSQARKVAAILDIPFYVINAKEIFYDKVVQPFLQSYQNGMTPNPCLWCNRQIRFDYLFKHCMELGAEFMATGHYVQKVIDTDGNDALKRAVDDGKDQSYVLHVLEQSVLRQCLFPIGEHPKARIREIAGQIGLPVAKRPDSQDLCFLAGEDYRGFLSRHLSEQPKPGNMVDQSGKVIGKHSGLHLYTIGQRKGLGITTPQPYYVVRKDIATNNLVVGDLSALGTKTLTAGPMTWTKKSPPQITPFSALVKTRYTSRPAMAKVTPNQDGSQVLIEFDQPQRDITPGQAAVVYDDDLLLGGGIILTEKNIEQVNA